MSSNAVRPEPRTVRQLLTEDHYEIPVYQRNYAWGEEEIRQLIDDLLDAARDGRHEYFLGNLVASTAAGTARDPRAVIDGQQRLTTLHLLFAYIATPRVPEVHPLRFESRPRASRAIGALGSSEAVPEGVDTGVLNGFKIISQYERSPRLRAPDVVEFILNKVRVVRIELPDGTDLNRYFEVMNTRGEQLQQQDIVKARMMSRLTDGAARSTFAWVWDACASMDAYVQMTLTPGLPDLRNRLFGLSWAWPEIDSFDALVGLNPRVAEQSSGAVLGGARSIDEAIDGYARAPTARADEDDPERFTSIIQFPALLLHVLRVAEGGDGKDDEDEDSLDDKRLVKQFDGYLASERAEQRVKAFALALLRCRVLFDAFVLKRELTARTGDDGVWSLKRLVRGGSGSKFSPRYVGTYPLDRAAASEGEADGDSDASKRVRLLEAALRVTYTSPRTMHWITRLLRLAIAGGPDELTYERLIVMLEGYARGKVRGAFDSAGALLPTGFDVPRIVFTYLDYLLAVRARDLDFQFTFRNSIEHFYPQSPDADLPYERLDHPADRDRFGNLALVTVRDNSKFTNGLPDVKARMSRIVEQSPKLGEMAKQASSWGSDAIRAHERAMVDILWSDVASVERIVPRSE